MKKLLFFVVLIVNNLSVYSQKPLDQIWNAYEANDYEKVIKLGKSLADKNGNDKDLLEVQELVGDSYRRINNMEQCIKYFRIAGENGSGWACFYMGLFYANGQNVEKDLDKAEYWLKKCIDLDNRKAVDACMVLAQIYLNSGKKKESELYFKKAMAKGERKAAPVFLADNFCEREEEKALGFYRIAAENGNEYAMKKMGDYFEEGKFVEKDFIEAAKWYERAYYESNNWKEHQGTMNKLGHIYEKQYRKTMDERALKTSLKWYYKSVELNPFGATEAVFEDGVLKAIDPIHRYFEEGVLDAFKYKDFDQWKEKVVAKLAIDSDVDINIPQISKTNLNTYALIITNENYDYEQYVPYAENDGTIFTKYCQRTLGIPEKNIHTVNNVSLNMMKREIDWLISTVAAQNGEKVIFYYSGHGVPSDNQSTSFLLPKDGYAKNPTTGYDLAELNKEFEKLNAECIVLLDACFSGVKKQGGMLVESKGVAIRPKEVKPSNNTITISACQGTETANVYEVQKHGLFTYFILKKLQESEGKVSLDELFNYVKNNVIKTSLKIHDKQQTPSISCGDKVQDIKTKQLY